MPTALHTPNEVMDIAARVVRMFRAMPPDEGEEINPELSPENLYRVIYATMEEHAASCLYPKGLGMEPQVVCIRCNNYYPCGPREKVERLIVAWEQLLR